MDTNSSQKNSYLPAVIISLFIALAILMAGLFMMFIVQSKRSQTATDKQGFIFTQDQLSRIYAQTVRVSGPADAPITIVEFSDFECPYCSASFPIVKDILARYQGKIRFMYVDFIATDAHEHASMAAQAARCAQEQGAFWPYHDKLFLNQSKLDKASLSLYALQIGIDEKQHRTCMDSGKYEAAVFDDTQFAASLGMVGTPTWAINEYRLQGVVPEEVWVNIIENILSQE